MGREGGREGSEGKRGGKGRKSGGRAGPLQVRLRAGGDWGLGRAGRAGQGRSHAAEPTVAAPASYPPMLRQPIPMSQAAPACRCPVIVSCPSHPLPHSPSLHQEVILCSPVWQPHLCRLRRWISAGQHSPRGKSSSLQPPCPHRRRNLLPAAACGPMMRSAGLFPRSPILGTAVQTPYI